MAKLSLPRVKPGDEITTDLINALLEAAERAQLTLGYNGGLQGNFNKGGGSISLKAPSVIWAKITANNGAGSYNFTQQYPVSGGTWTAGTLTGTCYEENSNATIATNTYVRLWLSAAGDWRTNYDHC